MSTERDAGRESTEPLTPARLAEIAEDHWQANTGQHAGRCDFCGDGWPCGPKLLLAEVDRLTEALAAKREHSDERVEQVTRTLYEELLWCVGGPHWDSDGWAPENLTKPAWRAAVRRALAGDTEGAGR